MKLTIIEAPGDVQVWAALPESTPPLSTECFVIGTGETRAAAIEDARKTLHDGLHQLLDFDPNADGANIPPATD
jgi:hypothetical protein